MSQDIRDFVPPTCELLAFGEPTHQEPAFPLLRNALFAQLVELGFRSIALESDRVAALTVDDYVRHGIGSLDEVMRTGFSHFGDLPANRELVVWMRDYNASRPPAERVAFYGFDAPLDNTSAPSPRRYLEFARDYLRLERDIADLAGEDERWHRDEAILDPAMSPGDTGEARRLHALADDLLNTLYARAPELISATSEAEWRRAAVHLTAALGLLRYHRQSARRVDETTRISGLLATRDVLMTENVRDIRDIEAQRGPTLLYGHNVHLQRNLSTMAMAGMTLRWYGPGAILSALFGDRFTFLAGSLGPGPTGLDEQDKAGLQNGTSTWGLFPAAGLTAAPAGPTSDRSYFPLGQETIDGADAVLHIADRRG
ncbi:erythromycin esterase family protein [Nocardia sp. NPDC055053]